MSPISDPGSTQNGAPEELEVEVDFECFQKVLNTITALQLEYESLKRLNFLEGDQAVDGAVEPIVLSDHETHGDG